VTSSRPTYETASRGTLALEIGRSCLSDASWYRRVSVGVAVVLVAVLADRFVGCAAVALMSLRDGLGDNSLGTATPRHRAGSAGADRDRQACGGRADVTNTSCRGDYLKTHHEEHIHDRD
jgi:hypothetical protein